MDNFSVHKWLREVHLNENKGAEAADKLLAQLREKTFRKFDDDELDAFKKRFLKGILLDSEYEKLYSNEVEEEDEVKPQKTTIPAYKVVLSWIDGGRNAFYGMYIYREQSSKTWDHKLKYDEAKAFLAKYNIEPELPMENNMDSEKDIMAILEQLRNREVIAHEIPMDVS